jgi:pentatricopeptide repeat protein
MFEQHSCLDNNLDGSRSLHVINPSVSTQLLNDYLDALVHLGRLPEIEEAIKHFKSTEQRPPNRRTYELLMRAYMQSLNLRRAHSLLVEMVACGIKIDRGIVHTLLRGAGKWAVTLELIDSFLELVSSASNMDFCDMKSYNLIIEAYLRRDRPEKARCVLDKVLEKGLKPDAETFFSLMRYQAKKEGSRGVYVIFNSMKMFGIRKEARHLNVLISMLARERRVDLRAASSLFVTHHLSPDIVTCNIILRALLSGPFKFQDLQAHFDEMEKLDIRPDSYTFTILVDEHKYKNRHWRHLHQILRQQSLLNDANVNQITANVLLHYMISIFPWPPKRKLQFPKYTADRELQLQWDVHTLTSLIAAYSRSKNWDRIMDIHSNIKKRQVKLDRHFYRVLVKSLLDGKKYREATEAAGSMLRSDEVIDQLFGRECMVRIAHAMFRDTRRGKHRATQSIDRFLKFSDEKGLTLSEKHCNLIAIVCLDASLDDLAIEILESRYERRGRFQDLEKVKQLGMSSWVILMRAYARKGKKGVLKLRSCIDQALSKELQQPTRTFLDFLHYLGVSKRLRSTNPADCDFFLQKRMEYVNNRRRESQTRFRSGLTKTNILRWVNNLD